MNKRNSRSISSPNLLMPNQLPVKGGNKQQIMLLMPARVFSHENGLRLQPYQLLAFSVIHYLPSVICILK